MGSYLKVLGWDSTLDDLPPKNLKDECKTFLGFTVGYCSGVLSGVATQECSSLLCAWPSHVVGSVGMLNWIWWRAVGVPLQAAVAQLLLMREEQAI